MEVSLPGVSKPRPFFWKITLLMFFTCGLGAFRDETLVLPHTAAVLSRVGRRPALKSQHPTPTPPKRACWVVRLHNKSMHECGVTPPPPPPPRVHLYATPPTVGRSFEGALTSQQKRIALTFWNPHWSSVLSGHFPRRKHIIGIGFQWWSLVVLGMLCSNINQFTLIDTIWVF